MGLFFSEGAGAITIPTGATSTFLTGYNVVKSYTGKYLVFCQLGVSAGSPDAWATRWRWTNSAVGESEIFGETTNVWGIPTAPDPIRSVDCHIRVSEFTKANASTAGSVNLEGYSESGFASPVPATLLSSAIALIPMEQFNTTYFASARSGGEPFPFSGGYKYSLAPTTAVTRTQLAVTWPADTTPRAAIAFADFGINYPTSGHMPTLLYGAVNIGHTGPSAYLDTLYIRHRGLASSTQGVPGYSTGRAVLRVGSGAFYAQGWLNPYTHTSTLNRLAGHNYAFVCLEDQSAVTTGGGVVTAGPKVSIGVGYEAASLSALTALPITPQITQDIQLDAVGIQIQDSESGYTRTWPLFLVPRRAVVLQWLVNATDLATLRAFFNTQTNAAFKATLQGESTERAFTVVGGSLTVERVGFNKPASVLLGSTEGDRMHYLAAINALELVRIGT